jgi:hypothetical protein
MSEPHGLSDWHADLLPCQEAARRLCCMTHTEVDVSFDKPYPSGAGTPRAAADLWHKYTDRRETDEYAWCSHNCRSG